MKKVLFLSLVGAFVCWGAHAQTKKVTGTKTTLSQKAATAAKKAPNTLKISITWPKETLVEITTNLGTMVAKLYNSTPRHRDNFIKLVKQGFYDSLLFHRVIKDFMIQGGDPNSKNAPAGTMLGMGAAPGLKVPAEFNPAFFHKKGALAAARDGNPEKASSNCQFYIVKGKPIEAAQLTGQNNSNAVYSPAQNEIYQRLGGTPFLDQNYTVFGEVVSGLEIIDKITAVQTGENNRPLPNVIMKMRVLN